MGGIFENLQFNFDITQVSITDADIAFFFFKAFSIVFALLFFIYSVILARQTGVLKDTLSTENNGIIMVVSQVQLIASVLILLYALFLI